MDMDIDKKRHRTPAGLATWDITDKGPRNFRLIPTGTKASLSFGTYEEMNTFIEAKQKEMKDNETTTD